MSMQAGTMVLLSDSGYILIDSDQDVRGRKVLDHDGNEIGEVDDLLIDAERKVRLLRVKRRNTTPPWSTGTSTSPSCTGTTVDLSGDRPTGHPRRSRR